MTSENGAVEDLTGTPVVIVTGASSGIGRAAAQELAGRGWRLALLGRDAGRLEAAAASCRALGPGPIDTFQCDFTSLDHVRAVAAAVRERYPKIDVLANNAGGNVFSRRSTVDGFEETIQSNHLAHFLLSMQLRENLRGGRIINTSSAVHMQGRLDPEDLNGANRGYSAMAFYGNAKQANVLFAVEATKRWPDIVSTAFHPGVVRTRFGRESGLYSFFYKYVPGLRTPAKGAETLVWLATVDRGQIHSGGYYQDKRERTASARATDPAAAQRLWEVSEAAVTARP